MWSLLFSFDIRISIYMNKPELKLISFAAASLYLELAVIRFTSAEVVYLGYFSNFILISAFVGLGLGFLSANRKISLDKYFPMLFLFLFSLVISSKFDVDILFNHFGLFFFGNIQKRVGLPGAVLLMILFLVTVFLFAGIGNRIADSFRKFTPLKAYTLDIIGSLAGICLFTVQCYIGSSPLSWVIVGNAILISGYLFSGKLKDLSQIIMIAVSCICTCILVLSSNTAYFTKWSMYQKLEVVEDTGWGGKLVFANSIAHQTIDDLESARNRYYATPYELKKYTDKILDDVLIVGSGTGTDLAVALSYEAKNIDAVEIDSTIVEIGELHHPDKPYQDKKVNVIIDDGRHFLHTTDKKYDLIVFALPDSLMRISALSSIRLESYLFTQQAFHDVKNHLNDSGIFVMYNQYRWEWLVDKLAAGLEEVFGKPPLLVRYADGKTTTIAIGKDIEGTSYEKKGFERLAVDDWPFLYMQKPGLHWLYIGMIAMFLLFSLLGVYWLAPTGTLTRPDLPYFFMGAAFLLLETKSLVFFSLLFGTTWLVNSLVFSGVLISVLLANLMVSRFKIKNTVPLYVALFSSILVMYIVPNSFFLNIGSELLRYAVGVVAAFTPIFFANLIFSREFRDTGNSTEAFGWNLLGAVAGGGLEYLSLLIGFKNLLWIVAFFYLCVALLTVNNKKLIRI